MLIHRFIQRGVLFSIAAALLLAGCGDSGELPKQDTTEDKEKKGIDPDKVAIFQVGDEMFALPSPVQTAVLVKNSGANYDKTWLNDAKKAPSYATKLQKALNLGVYGADLAYITMYDQTQDAISYMNSSRKIADDLGVSSAFDQELLQRFEANLGNKDSLLTLVTEAYRASDKFLKNSERDDVGGLILAGGFIEALHFAANVAKQSDKPEIKQRIGEQRSSLENLIKLLQRYADDEEFAYFVEQLIDLYYAFDDVNISYEYIKPVTKPDQKLTIINSKSNVDITDEQLTVIIEKIGSIRSYIIG